MWYHNIIRQNLTFNIKNFKIALAVSGGKDSMGMVYALKDIPGIVALTVDHQLRKESAKEAFQVGQWMQDLNIPHVILTWEHPDIETDIQNKARKARYNLMTQWCLDNNVTTLMTAHHKEDQIETFFMRLAKGSGLKGLCVMQPCVDYNGVNIIRPFLTVSKKNLHTYIENNRWIDDPSNENLNFERVKFRPWVEGYLKLDPAGHILKTIDKLKEVDEYVDQQVEHIVFDKTKIPLMLEYVIFERIINKLFSQNGYPFKRKKTHHLYETLHKPNFKATTFGRCVFKRRGEGVEIMDEN